MKLTPVTSSNIKAVGYNGDEAILYVQFKNGKTFSYKDVSQAKCRRFLASDSVGSFFARNIKNNYKAAEVKPDAPENQTVKAILKRYPEAVSAVDGVRVGDVLCNNVNVPLSVINESNVDKANNEDKDLLRHFYIIGNADTVGKS